MKHLLFPAVIALTPLPIQAQTAQQICNRMISEGRGGGQSVQDCLCTHRVAVAVLDEDIQALVFDAWLTGNNNMAALEALPNPRRIERQLRTMDRTLEANCP